MIQPVEPGHFLISFFASAGVILAGASYAICYTWGRLGKRVIFLRLALAAYAVLAVSVWTLAVTLHLQSYWKALTALMLVGYFVAPRVIFLLCAATHQGNREEPGVSNHPQSEL